MKPLFDGVWKCQKWVANSNQTQLKPIICYTSWYFSRGGKTIFGALCATHSNCLSPSTESFFKPLPLRYKSHKPNGIIYKENREQLLCWYNWKRDHVNGQHQRNYYTGLSAIDLINQMSKCIMEKRE